MKNKQKSLINWKRAGRPAIHDKGIRHIKREKVNKQTSLHLTIKVRKDKADIKNKHILKALHHAIKRARFKRLKIIHYSLEYNHVHLLAESYDEKILHCSMQAFGISLAKQINKFKALNGTVYKHRYHLRKINSPRDLKNVLHYIFKNGIHHKRTSSVLDPYNSIVVERNLLTLYGPWSAVLETAIMKSKFLLDLRKELTEVLDDGKVYFRSLQYI